MLTARIVGLGALILAGVASRAQPSAGQPESKPPTPQGAEEAPAQWPPPPGPATAEDKALLERAGQALETGQADVSALLTDKTFASLHARSEFRELIAAHAKAAPLTICGNDEPGTRLTVILEFVDKTEQP